MYGGSFDPPHVAHVLMARHAAGLPDVDRVLVVPAFQHAFGKLLCPFAHRLRMCELAFEGLSGVEVSDVERTLGGVSYTVRLLTHLRDAHPDHALRLLVGADILAETARWRDFDQITALAPLLAVGRGGFGREGLDDDAPTLPAVSSTEIRSSLARGAQTLAMLPAAVAAYIREHGLYRSENT